MILRDLYCGICGFERKDVVFMSTEEEIVEHCPKCDVVMKNLCRCGSFKLVYDNKKDMCGWGSDGYATSQYYRKD